MGAFAATAIERIGYSETDKRPTVLKRQREAVWLNEVPSVCLQQSLRDLQVACSNFFDKRIGYPSFEHKDGAQLPSWQYNRATPVETDGKGPDSFLRSDVLDMMD